MKNFHRSPSVFFSLPLLGSCLIALLTFELPKGYGVGISILMVVAALAIVFDALLGVRLPARRELQLVPFDRSPECYWVKVLAWLVLFACVLDLTLFPLPLLHPEIYANFDGGRSHVRHISNMCWVLPIVGWLCYTDKRIRIFFIAVGLAFPVLVLDRNRLFTSVYGLAITMVFFSKRQIPWKTLIVSLLGALLLFAKLGQFRSGRLDWVALPFTEFYAAASPGFKWILLYIGAGIYNFSSIMAKGYIDSDFLINQLVPGAGGVETLGSTIPFDEPVINVGTEYFPFLMAWGSVGAVGAALFLYLSLVASAHFFRVRPNIISFLIFLRISYSCVMAGFAPQAYTWTNLGFIALCLLMQIFTYRVPLIAMSNYDRKS
ncbi:hypothetical protein [Pseudomonas sp. NPDC099000]|uniref:hypothetical protein n=1 Tax=Pseudomonas sp. NPDC099000 TaxID=3364488 RepID=UPI00383A91FF